MLNTRRLWFHDNPHQSEHRRPVHTIDHYAYGNALRRVDPAQKGGLTVLAIILCLLLDRPTVGLVTLGWMFALTVLWARVPPHVFGRTLLAEGLFLILSVMGVAISVSLNPPEIHRIVWHIGGLWVSTDHEAIRVAYHLFTRALGCAAALNFLILTTPLTDLIELMRRLHVPETLIELMTLIYRTIFVLLESMQRMALAQAVRLGYSSPGRALRSTALLGSQLFLDAYRRSQRMQTALKSRGIEGTLRMLPLDYVYNRRAWWVGAALGVSLVVVGIL